MTIELPTFALTDLRKLTCGNERHGDVQYEDGLVTDPTGHGLYFCNKRNIGWWLTHTVNVAGERAKPMVWIRPVAHHPGAVGVDICETTFRSVSIVVGKRMSIAEYLKIQSVDDWVEMAMQAFGSLLHLPDNDVDKALEVCERVLHHNGHAFQFFPPFIISGPHGHHFAMMAVTKDGEALKHVPQRMVSGLYGSAICSAAITEDPMALAHVPWKIQKQMSKETFVELINRNWRTISRLASIARHLHLWHTGSTIDIPISCRR